ncbi:hypothetical protein GCM10010273_55890 [Streptomyces lavendulocolor]
MCRGYINAYGLPLTVQEAVNAGLGHIVEIPVTADGKPVLPGRGRHRSGQPPCN